jgi:hypothetical protein
MNPYCTVDALFILIFSITLTIVLSRIELMLQTYDLEGRVELDLNIHRKTVLNQKVCY